MTARVYCSLIAVLYCLSGYLSITDALPRKNTVKPGECPPQSSGMKSCTTSCKSDSNCPNNEKCCSNGCGHYCTAPYTVKLGQCPKPKIQACAESCFHDGQCPATQKCCPTTCGHIFSIQCFIHMACSPPTNKE
uniref:WAP domain-containing protein n=1 Tax=Cyprinus carpio TaxID=7962 RepID=A0A8C2KAH8_CYPCA